MEYRREIDGLRALAVLPVILFHAGLHTFRGGFVGVDIFFVISGYLITSIILNDIERGRFSIIDFYERRARRILPALFFVIFVSFFLAWIWMLPGDMADFCKSLIAVSLFSSNFLFWRQSGYFDETAELKPLLHTWSLSVEEQYYLLFPIFILFGWRIGRQRLLALILLLGLVSLLFSHWAVNERPSAAYYLLPSRGWELIVGAIAAFLLNESPNKLRRNKLVCEVGALLGLGLIVYAIFSYSDDTPFPGVYALVPTIGALLVILFCIPSTSVGKLLGSKVFVAIGLISYSTYLWHQPLFAFARHTSLHEPIPVVFLLLSTLSILLGYLSWRYIETPFRNRNTISRPKIFLLSAAVIIITFGVGSIGTYTNGAFGRLDAATLISLESRLTPNYGLSEVCDGSFQVSVNCKTSDTPEVLLWGDSYAMHLVPGLIASYPEIRLIQSTMSTCGPFLGIAPISASRPRSWGKKCIEFNDTVLNYLKNESSIKYVLMSSPFTTYVDERSMVLNRDDEVIQGKFVALDSFINTVNQVRSYGKTVIVISPPATNGKNIGKCLKTAVAFREDVNRCSFSLLDAQIEQAAVWGFLNKVAQHVKLINLSDFTCFQAICYAALDGTLIYRDGGHLSVEGSAYIGKKIDFRTLLTDSGSGP